PARPRPAPTPHPLPRRRRQGRRPASRWARRAHPRSPGSSGASRSWHRKHQGPVLSDRARERSVLVALGSREGAHQTPQASEFPYEDATSTEAKLRLSNGSPPFRGNHLREDPTSPDRRAAQARVVRARIPPCERTLEMKFAAGAPVVSTFARVRAPLDAVTLESLRATRRMSPLPKPHAMLPTPSESLPRRMAPALLAAAMLLAGVSACAGTSSSHRLQTRGISLYYETEGHGPPLLLIHGGMGNGGQFDKQRPAFAPTHRLIVPDCCAQG